MNLVNKYVSILLIATGLVLPVYAEQQAVIEKPAQVQAQTNEADYSDAQTVSPVNVVKNPAAYLNKTIKMSGKFDKFTTVGLDYPPALRKTEDYITFMIYRNDTVHDIPLSEMKLFIKRTEAQKFIDLKSKDNVTIIGKVFSTALGDPWVDVYVLKCMK